MKRFALQAMALALLLTGTISNVCGQESEDIDAAIQESFGTLTNHYKERDWDAFKTRVSEKGWQEFKRQIVISTFMWVNAEYPIPLNNAKEIREKVKAIYAEHGVAELNAPNLNEMIDGFDIESYEAFLAKAFEAADSNLNQSMNHEGLLTGLADALADANFPHFGDIIFRDSKLEMIELEGNAAIIKMTFEPRAVEGDGDIIVASQPFIVRFEQTNKVWQFDGMDMKRTLALMQEQMDADAPIRIDD